MKYIKKKAPLFSIFIGLLFFFPLLVHADFLDHWQVSSSFPQDTIIRIVYANTTFFALGESGAIATSSNCMNWTSRRSETGDDLRAVAYGNNAFVAVGIRTIVTSPDGITWTLRPSGTEYDLRSITYGNGTFVAVGGAGTIVTSPDGITWTARTSETWDSLAAITHGNGTFVAVGGSGAIVTSPDGITWTARTSETGYDLRGITYGNELFVAVAVYSPAAYEVAGTILTSPDGITWTTTTSGISGSLTGIAYGNDTFVAVGGNNYLGVTSPILTSSDGITWTPRESGTTNDFNGIAYGSNTFVAAGAKYSSDTWRGGDLYSNAILTSPDGIAWTAGTTTRLNGAITYGNDTFVAVGGGGTVLTSADGITWTSRRSGTEVNLRGIAYGNNTFVVVGEGGTVLTSPDAITWTLTVGTTLDLYAVAYGGNTFVALAGPSNICTSSDGIAWTFRWYPSAAPMGIGEVLGAAAVYGNNSFAAVQPARHEWCSDARCNYKEVIYSPSVITSPDAVTWTPRGGPLFSGIAYGNRTFVAVGYDGAIGTSSDGIVWTWRTSGTILDLFSIAYGGNTFVAVGRNGTILTSPDGTTWATRTSGTTGPLSGITYGNNTFVAIGYNTILLARTPEVQSSNATIAAFAVTNSIPGVPADFAVKQVLNFTATGVAGSADFSVTYDTIPANPAFFQVVGGTWKQLYPQNECHGITNLSLDGTTLNYTMSASSDCNGIPSSDTIVEKLVAGTMVPPGNGDINHDGQVNLRDAVLTLQVITGISPQEVVYENADPSGSEQMGLPGVIYILQKEAGMR